MGDPSISTKKGVPLFSENAEMAEHRLRCTAVFLLLALVAAGTSEDAAVGAAADAYAQLESSSSHPTMQPPTQLTELTPFAGGDGGWERMSITSSVDRMMGNVQDDSEDNDYVSDDFESDDFSDEDDEEDSETREEKEYDDESESAEDKWNDTSMEDGDEDTFDYAPITKEEDPLIAEVLPPSVANANRKKAQRQEAQREKAALKKPSTDMMDNPLIDEKLKKQIKKEMGEPISKSKEEKDIEQDVKKVLLGEKSHTMELEKELAKAKSQAAAAKKRQRKLERALRAAATTKVKKKASESVRKKKEAKMSKSEKKFSHMVITTGKHHPLALKKEDALASATKDPIKSIKGAAKKAKKSAKKAKKAAKKVKKAVKKVSKSAKKAAKKVKSKAKKAAAKKAMKKEVKRAVKDVKKMKAKAKKKDEKAEVKKLLHKAKKNVKKAKKVQTKTQKRLAHWASHQVIDDPEDAVKNFKNKAQEKIHKKRANGDGRNHSGHWANKYDYYSDGYISNNAYLDKYGHYHLGMSRRRIGAGFARRRRGTGFSAGKWVGRVHSRMLRKIVKGHSLLREGLKEHKGERNIYGHAPKHPRKKKKPPPGIEEADKNKLTPAMKEALLKSGAGIDAEVDKSGHFAAKTVVKIGGKSLAHSLGEKAKAAKKTAKLAAKVKDMVSNALKGIASKAASKSYSSGGKGKNAAKAAIAKAKSAAKSADKKVKKASKAAAKKVAAAAKKAATVTKV